MAMTENQGVDSSSLSLGTETRGLPSGQAPCASNHCQLRKHPIPSTSICHGAQRRRRDSHQMDGAVGAVMGLCALMLRAPRPACPESPAVGYAPSARRGAPPPAAPTWWR